MHVLVFKYELGLEIGNVHKSCAKKVSIYDPVGRAESQQSCCPVLKVMAGRDMKWQEEDQWQGDEAQITESVMFAACSACRNYRLNSKDVCVLKGND